MVQCAPRASTGLNHLGLCAPFSYDGLLGMWIDAGCRGEFECDGAKVTGTAAAHTTAVPSPTEAEMTYM